MRRTMVASLLGSIAVLAARPASALSLDNVPHSVDLTQKVTLSNGQVITKGEFLKRIPRNQMIRLRSGKTISWENMLKLMKMLEDRSKTPLATMPRATPLRPQTAGIVARQRQQQAAEIAQMRQLESTHWASVIQRKYQHDVQFGGAPRYQPQSGCKYATHANPNAGGFSGCPGSGVQHYGGGGGGGGSGSGLPSQSSPGGTTGGTSGGSGGSNAPTCSGTPDRTPDDAPWSTTLGDPSAVSATLSFDFADKGDKSSAGCSATLDATTSVLNNAIDIAKAQLSGTASAQSISGQAAVFLFGAQIWSESGSIGSQNDPLPLSWSHSWNSPTVQIPVFAGVVYLETGASVGLSIGVKVADVPANKKASATDDTIASCGAQFGPNADAKATGFVQIAIDLPDSIKTFLNTIGVNISDIIAAGLEGTIDVANVGVPTTGQISLGPWDEGDDRECDSACGHDPNGDECTHFCSGNACMVLAESLNANLAATFLDGSFDAYLEIANPCFLGACLSDVISSFTGDSVPTTQDKSQIKWTWTIYSWPGFQYTVPIFSAHDLIALR